MNQYGEIAIAAVKILLAKKIQDPKEAWEEASIRYLMEGSSSQKKVCPRNAFLGLCSAGLIRGINKGDYTKSEKNKSYVVEAVKILEQQSNLSKKELWRKVLDACSQNLEKKHNQQMDVVLALFNKRQLVD